ncbi:MAG: agmatinase [Planctomycetota bacterium]|jgi:agmatinase
MSAPFDPDDAAAPGSGIFGLECGPDEARVQILAVPFDATTSYRRGAAWGPAAVAAASHQVELYDRHFGKPYEAGIWLEPDDGRIAAWNAEARALAEPILERGGRIDDDPQLAEDLARVDALGEALNEHVQAWSEGVLDADGLPFVLGGDHAVPYGNLAACAARYPELGVLHIDAHADLRPAYEGFRWSHASILYNALEQLDGITQVLQVGLRDLGQGELRRIRLDERLSTVFDDDWSRARMNAEPLAPLVRSAIEALPQDVYVTIDIDGLEPALCPHTGTPVPGGLSWAECILWLEELVASGRRIVGADLVEVSPGSAPDQAGESWDAVVGARLLYKLIGAALGSKA